MDEIERFRVNFERASWLQTRWAFSNYFSLLFRYLYLLVEVFLKVSIHSVLVMNSTRKRRDLYVFGCSICRFSNKWRCEDIDEILLHWDNFSSVYSAGVVCQARILLFGINCSSSRAISVPHVINQRVFFTRWGVKFDHCVKIPARLSK